MADPLKFGVVGLGIGRIHTEGYLNLQGDGVRLAAVCDQVLADRERGPGKAMWGTLVDAYQTRGISLDNLPKVYSSYEEMYAKAGLDGVSICLPNYLHADAAIRAFEAGLHVLLEKPMAPDLSAADRILVAWKKAGTVGMGQLNNNYRPEYRVVNEFIQSGKLGKVQRVKGWWNRRNGTPFSGFWFTQKAKSGGGPGIDLLPHPLGMLGGLLGWPAWSYACAHTIDEAASGQPGYGCYGGGKHDPNGINDVEKSITGWIRFENGVVGQVEAAWVSHDVDENMGIEVVGTEGKIRVNRRWPKNNDNDAEAIDTWSFHTTVTCGGCHIASDTLLNDDHSPLAADPLMGRTKTQPELVRCIRDRSSTPHTSLDNLHWVQKVIDALYRSAGSGAPIQP